MTFRIDAEYYATQGPYALREGQNFNINLQTSSV